MKRLCTLSVILAGFLFSSGCVAIRSTTNIHAPADAGTLTLPHKFRLEKVQYSVKCDSKNPLMSVPMEPQPATTPGAPPPPPQLVWNDEKWCSEIAAAGAQRYPGIFSTAPGSYPLSVTLDLSGHPPTVLSIIGPELLTLCVLGGILPLPVREYVNYEVTPTLLLDEGMTQVPLASVQFQRREVMWITVFTPLGLIPVFGHADRRQSMALPQMMNPPKPEGYSLNIESCVDAIVLSLQSSVDEIRNALTGRSPTGKVIPP